MAHSLGESAVWFVKLVPRRAGLFRDAQSWCDRKFCAGELEFLWWHREVFVGREAMFDGSVKVRRAPALNPRPHQVSQLLQWRQFGLRPS